MAEKIGGRCLCGKIKFEIEPPIVACVNCHCESCRRQCSAPMTTFIGINDGQWKWTSGTAKVFHSSPGVERTFCGDCGTPMSFRSTNMTGVMHFYVAALDDPEAIQPSMHAAHEEKLSWLHFNDDLKTVIGPKYR